MSAETFIPSKEFMDKVYADLAREAGITVDEYETRLAKDNARVWCQCGNPSKENYFHDDGVTPAPSCVGKHHWHCQDCGKVVQIG